MKIKSVRIHGLFNEFDYDLNLNPDLTFLHSPNGCGKTVLMHLVYSLFRSDAEYVEETPFNKLFIDFSDDSTLSVQNDDGKVSMQMKKSGFSSISFEDLERVIDVNYLPPERMTIRKKDGHLVNTLEYYAQELYETIRRAKDDRELSAPPKEGRKEMSDSELEFWCKDLKAKLDFIADAGFQPEIPENLRFPPSRYDLMDNRQAYEDLAFSIAEYVERNYPLSESIIVYKDIVNDILINKTIDVSDSGKIVITMRNGTALPLNKLSSGESQILVMFYSILFHCQAGSLLIVDEPEISLHVSWQQTLGDYFNDISRVRNIQMVITTHSPQIIHDKWDLAQELVRKNA